MIFPSATLDLIATPYGVHTSFPLHSLAQCYPELLTQCFAIVNGGEYPSDGNSWYLAILPCELVAESHAGAGELLAFVCYRRSPTTSKEAQRRTPLSKWPSLGDLGLPEIPGSIESRDAYMEMASGTIKCRNWYASPNARLWRVSHEQLAMWRRHIVLKTICVPIHSQWHDNAVRSLGSPARCPWHNEHASVELDPWCMTILERNGCFVQHHGAQAGATPARGPRRGPHAYAYDHAPQEESQPSPHRVYHLAG